MGRRLVAWLAALLLAAYPVMALAQPQKDRQAVRVGYSDSGPCIIVDEEGSYSGYGYEYLEAIVEQTGWRYELVPGTWEQCLQRLANGQIDMVGGAVPSPARREQFAFSQYEAGIEYAMLYVRKDKEVYYGEYGALDGLLIGMISNNSFNADLDAFARKHGFTYRQTYFDKAEILIEALEAGEVDAILTGSLQQVTGQKLVAKFAPTPFYYAVRKGNGTLLRELDEAMESIQTMDVGFAAELYRKYYGTQELLQLAYTREEADCLAHQHNLRVAYAEGWRPIQYFNERTQRFSGISAGILSLIADRSGLAFTYVPAKDELDAIRMVEEGEADLICGYPKRYAQEAHRAGIQLTKPYFEAPITLVKPVGVLLEQVHTIAVPQYSLALTQYARGQYPQAELINLKDSGACMEAVRSGRADAALVNLYALEQYGQDRRYENLTPDHSQDLALPICLAASERLDSTLYTLLNKLVTQVEEKQLSQVVAESTMQGPHLHWDSILAALFPLALLVLLLIILIIYLSKKRVERYAFTDQLTGRDNEPRFLLQAEKLLNSKGYAGYVVVSLDIDRFKMINGMHSFEVGNRILKGVSGVLVSALGQGELCCRKAEDRFMLLLRQEGDLDGRLRDMIKDITALPQQMGESFQYAVSCGVYAFTQQDHDLHRAIGWANMARKQAKTQHQGWATYFDDVMRKRAMLEQEMENRLQAALSGREFEVYFQPKVRLCDSKTVGAEALVRWMAKDGSVFTPDQFIPVFENDGSVVLVDLYVFEEICRQLRKWLDWGIQPCPVSVNLSRVHLKRLDFHQQYLALMRMYRIPAELIKMELTESAFSENREAMIALVRQLKEAGLSVSMDDFGTGYSSLNLLKDLPLNELKLDKGFFSQTGDILRGREVIRSVADMAGRLNMTVVAEGVETGEQVAFLKSTRCQIVQGYYYSKPLPVDRFEQYMGWTLPAREQA